MPILTINCNARLVELLNGQPSGTDRSYIYNPSPKKKLENQVFICKEGMDDGYKSYIEVKFVSQYSSRERRIEVVGMKGTAVRLYQFSSRASFDQDANDLERLINEIKSYSYTKAYDFSGTIVLTDKGADLAVLKQALNDLGLSIDIKQI